MVQEAISQLPPKQRIVVSLFYMQHLKYHEIAEVLDCPGRDSGIAIKYGDKDPQVKTAKPAPSIIFTKREDGYGSRLQTCY